MSPENGYSSLMLFRILFFKSAGQA